MTFSSLLYQPWKGVIHYPSARSAQPRVVKVPNDKPCKGDIKMRDIHRRSFCTAPSGLDKRWSFYPGFRFAAPWAVEYRPFRAEMKEKKSFWNGYSFTCTYWEVTRKRNIMEEKSTTTWRRWFQPFIETNIKTNKKLLADMNDVFWNKFIQFFELLLREIIEFHAAVSHYDETKP